MWVIAVGKRNAEIAHQKEWNENGIISFQFEYNISIPVNVMK